MTRALLIAEAHKTFRDNDYTVFGEVTSGMSVVDKISQVITDDKNRPLKNVYLSMKVLK